MTVQTDTLQLSRIDIENLPNYRRCTQAGEYSSACPFCQAGKDRFRFWPDKGNYWCRRCEAKGFVVESNALTFSQEQYEAWKRAEQERQQKERQQQLDTIGRLSLARAELYHEQMTDRSYWYEQGLTDETIDRFKLGYSPTCPTYPDSPSWTIPIFYQGRLYNIRHRLAKPNGSGKYRPEMAGLPTAVFNADVLNTSEWMIVLVEGEVKAMCLQQFGFSAVGIPGANSFKPKWAKLFKDSSIVYIALDPGAEQEASGIGIDLANEGIQVRVCHLPVKPDDFFVKYHGSVQDFFRFLMLGRKKL